MMFSHYVIIAVGLLLSVLPHHGTGFYIQPDILFLSGHPESQYVVAGSDFSLSCAVQLRGLRDEEGGLNVPVVQWIVNDTYVSDVFPDAVASQNLTTYHHLRSTLHIPHSSHNHTGTYHCNIVDGTNEGERKRLPDLCEIYPCFPFITASHPATIVVLENSTTEEVVELHTCSSTILQCGSLLPALGLRPALEWTWDGTSLNGSSDNYHVLPNSDLALYHSTEGGMVGLFHCVASFGSNSVTIAAYTVVEGGHLNPVSFCLTIVSLSTQVTEDYTFSLLVSSSVCLDGTQIYVWTRNDSYLCSSANSSREIQQPQSDTRYECEGRVLTVSSASYVLDTGRYCCQIESQSREIVGTVCVDVRVAVRALPLLTSPHNDTTLTVNTSHSAQLTLSCTSAQLHTSHYWLYNGFKIPADESGLLVITTDVSSIGVYQCFGGNQFGYSVVTLRVVPEGLTNPPGLPQFYEIVRPDKFHRPAYFFSWLPPSYPADLGNVEYLLHNTFPPTPIQENSLERFISFDSYYYLHTSVLESSVQTSEGSPYVQRRFNEAKCHKYVYFPPLLSANCSRGLAGVSWRNSPDNQKYYSHALYSVNGPKPGRYFIDITCYFINDAILETGGMFMEEGFTTFEEELPVGAHCVFKGAATPANGPASCLDPAVILYENNTSCQMTTYVEFENSSYVAEEGKAIQQICLTAEGYNFSVEVTATYDNSTAVTDVAVRVAGVPVCVSVVLRDDGAVNEEMNITLSLQADDDRVFTGPPAVITVLDDDVLSVGFSESNYEMLAGQIQEVCVLAGGELSTTRTASVVLDVDLPISGEFDHLVKLDEEKIVFNSSSYRTCVLLNASSAITEKMLLILSLTDEPGERAIVWGNKIANVTIIPIAELRQQTSDTSVIVVSLVILLMAMVLVILVSVLLVRRYFTRKTEIDRVLFPEKPMRYEDYVEPPHLLKFGSIPTICEPLELSTAVSSDDVMDPSLGCVVSTVNPLQFTPEMESEHEEGVDKARPIPKSRATHTSLASGKDSSSSTSSRSSVTGSSHHEYIASDSLMVYSSPPSVGRSYPAVATQVMMTNDTDVSVVTRTQNYGSGESGMGFEILGTSSGMNKETVSVAACLESLVKTSNGLLKDSDQSAFHNLVLDSGIDVEVDSNMT